MATLELQSIHKSFGSTEVLNDISLAINDKEFVVFVGPSGCGKSTLLRIVAGLEAASSGTVRIDGADVSLDHPVDRGISMVFQSYALYPHLSVFENIAFPLRVQKLTAAKVKELVENAASTLQLTDKLNLKPGQLSGGQRQRVAIGRSIVRNPKIFLFDEPLSNLDAALRGDMRVELIQLHQQLDATMVYVTHDQVEAMTMADRIVVLNDGRIEQFGTPMELYHHPASRFVAQFIGQPNMNFVPATIAGVDQHLQVELADGHRLQLPVDAAGTSLGGKIDIGIRPEDVTLADTNNGESGNLELSVQVLERLGGVSIVYGNLKDGSRFCASLPGDAPVRQHQSISLHVAPQHCHVFTDSGAVLRRHAVPELPQ